MSRNPATNAMSARAKSPAAATSYFASQAHLAVRDAYGVARPPIAQALIAKAG